MPGKRQHYLPRFLLRRFALDPTDKRSPIWRLARETGAARRANIVNEAVRSRYYRMVAEDGSVDDTADEFLDRIEDRAAPIIASLAKPDARPDSEGLMWLSLFIFTLKQRTPAGRRNLREMDRAMGRMWLEAKLSDRESMEAVLAKPGRSDADLEAERQRLLDGLRSGRFDIDSTASREVALMFLSLEQAAEALTTRIGWNLARAPEGHSFILSDFPVAHHDPTPKFPGAGAGFLSSDQSMTVVPLDPRFALLLVPHEPSAWKEVEADRGDVDDFNLIGYVWADDAIYGSSQEMVTRVRRRAKKDKAAMARFAKQPPRLWVAEVNERDPGAGVKTFASTVHGEALTRELYVTPEGAKEARRRAYRP